jgi:hypothetical protein
LEARGVGRGGGGQGGEMTQTMYAHINKKIQKLKEKDRVWREKKEMMQVSTKRNKLST